MSEYQYYEFRAIDRPLTGRQKASVSALSSRAYVTSHAASFVYNYGDFRGDPEKLMSSPPHWSNTPAGPVWSN